METNLRRKVHPGLLAAVDAPGVDNTAAPSLHSAASGCVRFLRALNQFGLNPAAQLAPRDVSFIVFAPSDEALQRFAGIDDPRRMSELCASHVVCLPPGGSGAFYGEGRVSLRSLQGTVHHGLVERDCVHVGAMRIPLEAVRAFTHGTLVPLPDILCTMHVADVASEQIVGEKSATHLRVLRPEKFDRVSSWHLAETKRIGKIERAPRCVAAPTEPGAYTLVHHLRARQRGYRGWVVASFQQSVRIEVRASPNDLSVRAIATTLAMNLGEAPTAIPLALGHCKKRKIHSETGNTNTLEDVKKEEKAAERQVAWQAVQRATQRATQRAAQQKDAVAREKNEKCIALMQSICKDNANPSPRPPTHELMDRRDSATGDSCLHILAQTNAIKTLMLVLSKPSCPIFARDANDRTPLLVAIQNKNGVAARVLQAAEKIYGV